MTSRKALDLPGERLIELGPLDDDSAAALLLERASARVAGWGTNQEDASVVRAITAALQNIPLALEIAGGTCRGVVSRARIGTNRPAPGF